MDPDGGLGRAPTPAKLRPGRARTGARDVRGTRRNPR